MKKKFHALQKNNQSFFVESNIFYKISKFVTPDKNSKVEKYEVSEKNSLLKKIVSEKKCLIWDTTLSLQNVVFEWIWSKAILDPFLLYIALISVFAAQTVLLGFLPQFLSLISVITNHLFPGLLQGIGSERVHMAGYMRG